VTVTGSTVGSAILEEEEDDDVCRVLHDYVWVPLGNAMKATQGKKTKGAHFASRVQV
jgi:hypothetical protein